MKPYKWIIFDADETLFHFDAYRGLQLMFSRYGFEFTEQHNEDYELVNQALWVEYQNGLITADQLQRRRFHQWGDKLDVPAEELGHAFMLTMAEICTPIEGAISLLNSIKQTDTKMGIITNGFAELQQERLERTGLTSHFDFLVISEVVGVAKPNPAIFDHALSMMGNPPREHVLMVGDTPASDILGGINAGLDTCWLNRKNITLPDGIKPLYQVSSHAELEKLLLGTLKG